MAIPRGLQVATAHPTACARAQEGPDPAGGTNSSSWHRGGHRELQGLGSPRPQGHVIAAPLSGGKEASVFTLCRKTTEEKAAFALPAEPPAPR